MSKSFLPFIFLFSTVILFGQSNKEIKFNVLGLLNEEYRPSFEIITKKRIGIEMETSITSRTRTYSSFDFNTPVLNANFQSIEYQNNRFEIALAGKYYFSKNKLGYGFFAGGYTGLNFITEEDENFAATHLSLFNRTAPEILYKKGANHIFYGLIGGYKFLIKENIVAELSMKYVNIDYFKSETTALDIDAAWFLKVGYRF